MHPFEPRLSRSDFARPPDSENGHEAPMMLGRLLAGQEHIIRSVDRIDARLLEGDRRMGYLVETSARLDERVASLERKREPSGASRAERLIARWAAIIIPLVALLATGSWEVAIKLIAALK